MAETGPGVAETPPGPCVLSAGMLSAGWISWTSDDEASHFNNFVD